MLLTETIFGTAPNTPLNSVVTYADFYEPLTQTAAGVISMQGTRQYGVVPPGGGPGGPGGPTGHNSRWTYTGPSLPAGGETRGATQVSTTYSQISQTMTVDCENTIYLTPMVNAVPAMSPTGMIVLCTILAGLGPYLMMRKTRKRRSAGVA